MNQYEAMFLFDPTFGSSFENCESAIHRLMERAQAEILFCRKWDERRLAYRIKGRKRGVYVLVLFTAPSDRIKSLERDAQISEDILRLLVLRADGVTPETMEGHISQKVESLSEGEPAQTQRAGRSEKVADDTGADEDAANDDDDVFENGGIDSNEVEPATEGESFEVR